MRISWSINFRDWPEIETRKRERLSTWRFINWVENSLNMDRTTANKFMKISRELSNDDTYRYLGTNALYMNTSLPEPEQAKRNSASNDEPIII